MSDVCKLCKIVLNDDNWLKSRKNRHSYICKTCENHKNNIRYSMRKEIYLEQINSNYKSIKQQVLKYYGGCCNLCGKNDTTILSLDHINKNGRKHRKEILKIDSGTAFYKWVLKNKPNDLRVLCYNCNCKVDMNKKELIINYNKLKTCKYCGDSEIIRRYAQCGKCHQINKRNKYIDLKLEVFEQYGGACMGCGEANKEYLTIDHINNDGNLHRKEIGTQIFPWLKNNGFPKDNYQILCFNCNYLKRDMS